jgi:hypothetical protein
MIIPTRYILITTSSHNVALLRLDYIWETVKLQYVNVSLFIRFISCWKTPQNVGNSLTFSRQKEINRLIPVAYVCFVEVAQEC